MENTKRTKYLVVEFDEQKFIKSIMITNDCWAKSSFSIFNNNGLLIYRLIMEKHEVKFLKHIKQLDGLEFKTLTFELCTADEVKIMIDKIDEQTVFFEDSYGLTYGHKVDEKKCIEYNLQYNKHGFIKSNNL
jgi:hypothetical protein